VVMITTLGGMAVFGIHGFVIGPAVAAMFMAVWHMHLALRALDRADGGITADPSTPPGVVFHPASGMDEAAVAQVQARLRTRVLGAFAGPAA
jgi:hypothetical protein